eukprot:UN23291
MFDDTEKYIDEDVVMNSVDGENTSMNNTGEATPTTSNNQSMEIETRSSSTKKSSKKDRDSFYVVLALKHRLHKSRIDYDLISRSNIERSRIVILEMNPDVLSTCTEKSKDTNGKDPWMRLIRLGPFKGIETSDVWLKKGTKSSRFVSV